MTTGRTGLSGFALAFTMATSAICTAPQFVYAQAADKPQSFRFDLAPASMSATLSNYSEVCGVQLVYSSDLVKGMQSAGLAGEFTATEALTRLLQGSGLTARFSTPTTASLTRARTGEARELGPVRVEGAEQISPMRGEGVAKLGGLRGGQDEEERGLRPVVAAVGAGAPTALEDIPRSVSVLTQTQIEAQDIQDFGEAVRRMPGLSMVERVSNTSGDDGSSAATGSGSVRSRGFVVRNVQVDGGAPRQLDIINNGLSDLSAYERVELVRGPNGVFSGSGSPGGSLNLVRKRPGAESTLDLTGTVGSFDRLRGSADWSTPSVLGTPFAFRGVVSHEDQKYKWDNDHLKRSLLYGIVDAPLGERARFEAGGTWQKIREDGFYQGSYRYYDGPNLDLPFYFNYVPEWSYVDAKSFELFSRVYVNLLEDWNFDLGLTYTSADKRSLNSLINGSLYLLSNTNQAYRRCGSNGVCTPMVIDNYVRETNADTRDLGVDFRITGKFKTWGLDHDVFLAGQYSELISSNNERTPYDPAWPAILTLDQFVGLSRRSPPIGGFPLSAVDDSLKNSSSSYGLTIADVISWRERIFLTLSERLMDQEASGGSLMRRRTDGAPLDVSVGEMFQGNVNRAQQWRPSWALAVKPLRALTIYGSYSESSDDQSQFFEPSGKQLGPSTYENSELGVKYGLWGWLLSASGYRLEQDNIATTIPGSRGLCGPTPTSVCYFSGGTSVESKGYDVEISGRLFNQLDLQASYTNNETIRLSTHLPSDTRAPEKLAKLFANWELPWIRQLSVNLGAVYTGRVYQQGTRTIYDPVTFAIVDQYPYQFDEAATMIWDIGADYQINDHFKLNLLIENVADTEYYSTVSSTTNHVGNPRTAMLRVTWSEAGAGNGVMRSPTTGLAPWGNPADWYGSLDFGQQNSGDWDARSTGKGASGEPVRWKFETEPSVAFGARLGYRLTDHWRTEADFGWRQSEFGKVGGSGTVPYGLCSLEYASNFVGTAKDRLTHCYDPQGEAVYWSFLANVIHDFRSPDARLRPFLGVGVGATRASVDFSGRFDGYTDTAYRSWYQRTYSRPLPSSTAVAPGEKVIGGDASWGVSFQAIAGMSWRVTERATLDATYRYTRDQLDVRAYNLTDYYPQEFVTGARTPIPEPNRLSGAGLPQLGSFKGDLDSHIFSVGLRWAFGAKN